MDKIMIRGAKYDLHLGVTEEERKTKQQILVDVTLFFDITAASSTDDIEKSINYSHISRRINAILTKEYKLIETVAEIIAQDILVAFPVNKIKICVKKPQALRIADYTAVEIVREK